MAALLLLISFGVFALLYIAPGSLEQILLGTEPATPETIQAIREKYHLDEPLTTQYWIWLRDALQLDFGTSIRTREPVLAGIAERMGVTLFLGAYAFLLAVSLGIALGVWAAVRSRSSLDRAVVATTVIGVSTPAFASGIILLYLFAVILDWFPVVGAGEGFVDRLWHLTLPAIALALTGIALIVKLTRASMIEALDQDYIVFARARGISSRALVWRYALRNALVPVVTSAGLLLGYMLTGAVLVEVTFALPGAGSLLVDSVLFKDVPMVQGLTIIVAAIVITANLLTDLAYVAVDPRIRFTRLPG